MASRSRPPRSRSPHARASRQRFVELVSPIVADVRSLRVEAKLPDESEPWLDDAQDEPVEAMLSPADGAVLPPDLGRLEVDFAAFDGDDVHEVVLRAPHLDVRVIAAGAPGPRHVALDAIESAAIASTCRGEGVELVVRSLASTQPARAHRASAHLAFADRDLGVDFAFGVPMPDAGVATAWTYDVGAGKATPWKTDAPCLGCHYAASVDGRRIAFGAGGQGFGFGVVYDALTHEPIVPPDPDVKWGSATYDPGGRIVSAFEGVLTLRDGDSLAPIGTVSTEPGATQPAIDRSGERIVFGVAPDGAPYPASIPTRLMIADWDASSGVLGPPSTLVEAEPGAGLELPTFVFSLGLRPRSSRTVASVLGVPPRTWHP